MTFSKINSKGKYTYFPGITFLSMLNDRESSDWAKYFKYLKSKTLVNKYYSILPLSSLHMTIKNHISAIEDLTDYLLKNSIVLDEMKNVCKRYSISPKVKVVDMYFGSTMGLLLEPEYSTQIESLRKELTDLGSKREVGYRFHMTFGYRYKKIEDDDIEGLKREINSILNRSSEFLSKVNYKLQFDTVMMYYFTSMKNYSPMQKICKYSCLLKFEWKGKIYDLATFNSNENDQTISNIPIGNIEDGKFTFDHDYMGHIDCYIRDFSNFRWRLNTKELVKQGNGEVVPEKLWIETSN